MYYLFQTDPNQINPEIKHTDFRDYYPAISMFMSWKNVVPYIRQAYFANILPYVGTDLWSVLNANALLPVNDQDASLSELSMLIKQALALYAINLGYPELNTHISDGMVSTPAPDKAMPVSQWAFVAARWNLIIRAEKNLDLALEYIIKNNIAPWSAGDDYKHPLMAGAVELQKYVKVNGHRAYMAMHPYFDKAVQNLGAILSCDVMDDIMANIDNPDYAGVVDDIKRYIAHYTLEITIPRMLTFVEGDSLVFIHNADGIKEGTGVYSKPNMEAVQMLIASCKRDYASTLEAMILKMRKDPTTFAAYATYLDSLKDESAAVITTDMCGNVVGGVGFF